MNEKHEAMLWAFCIIVMLALTTRTVLDGQEYKCNSCTVDFSTKLPASQELKISAKVPVEILYQEWLDGNCIVTWDPNTGFRSSYGLTGP